MGATVMLVFIIDRFEGSWAVLEASDGTIFNFPRSFLPAEAREGDVLVFDIAVDREATEKRKKEVKDLLDDLRSQDEGSDIEL